MAGVALVAVGVMVSALLLAPAGELAELGASGEGLEQVLLSQGSMWGILGALFGGARLHLYGSFLNWQMPGLRTSAFLENLLAGLLVAVLSGVTLLTLMPPGVGMVRSIGVILFVVACFAMGAGAFDPAMPKFMKIVAYLGFYVLLFGGRTVARVIMEYDWAVLMACAILIPALWLRESSRRAARGRPRNSNVPVKPSGARGIWEGLASPDSTWTHPLTSSRIRPWLLASAYESGSGSAWRPASFMAFNGLAIAFTIQFIGSDFLALTLIAAIIWSLAVFSFRLRAGLVYPLSRSRRAHLVATGAMLLEAAIVVLAVGFLLLIKATPLADIWHSRGPRETVPWPVTLLVAFAWMPIVSWGSVRAAAGAWREGANVLTSGLVPLAAYVLSVLLTLGTFGDWWREGQVVLVVSLIVAISVLTRMALWWATQRHFATADLAPVANPG